MNPNLKPWKKGQSGNPGGRPKTTDDERTAVEILKGKAAKAALVVAQGVDGKRITGTMLRCAENILNRVLGTPRQTVEVQGEVAQFVALLPTVIENADAWEAKVQAGLANTVRPLPAIDLKAEPAKAVELTPDERRAVQRITPAPAKPDGTRFYDDRIEPATPDKGRKQQVSKYGGH